MTATRRALRKSSATRQEDFVAAVFSLLAKGSASAVSTAAVARRVGVTQSALFKHYRNKEALWKAVMDALAVEVGSRLEAAARSGGSRADRMLAIIKAYLSVMRERPAIPALMFADPKLLHGAGKYVRAEVERRFGWFHRALLEQIEAGMQTGEFRPDTDPQAAASLAAGIPQSLILRWRVSGGVTDMLAEADAVYPLFLKSIAI